MTAEFWYLPQGSSAAIKGSTGIMSITNITGFALGIMSAFFFAFYMVPQKMAKVDHTTFLWTMGIGVLFTSFIPYFIAGMPHAATTQDKFIALICGVMWGLGTFSFAGGIQRIGLSLATPIKNTTGILGALVGLLALQEWKTTDPWLTLLGSLLIVAAAIIIGQTTNSSLSKRHLFSGVIFSLFAAICYASYIFPMQRVVRHINYQEFTPWMACGILITASIAVLLRPGGIQAFRQYPPRAYGLSLLGGASWAIALFALTGSMLRIELSISWSLAQLNTIPAVLIGMLGFHEIRFAQYRWHIILGLIAATLGTIVLGLAKDTALVARIFH